MVQFVVEHEIKLAAVQLLPTVYAVWAHIEQTVAYVAMLERQFGARPGLGAAMDFRVDAHRRQECGSL